MCGREAILREFIIGRKLVESGTITEEQLIEINNLPLPREEV